MFKNLAKQPAMSHAPIPSPRVASLPSRFVRDDLKCVCRGHKKHHVKSHGKRGKEKQNTPWTHCTPSSTTRIIQPSEKLAGIFPLNVYSHDNLHSRYSPVILNTFILKPARMSASFISDYMECSSYCITHIFRFNYNSTGYFFSFFLIKNVHNCRKLCGVNSKFVHKWTTEIKKHFKDCRYADDW